MVTEFWKQIGPHGWAECVGTHRGTYGQVVGGQSVWELIVAPMNKWWEAYWGLIGTVWSNGVRREDK
jgi:hypothetical protein